MDKPTIYRQIRECVLAGYQVEQLKKIIAGLKDITIESVDELFRQFQKKRTTHRGKLTPSLFRDKLKAINPNLAVESIMPMFSQKTQVTTKDIYEVLTLQDLHYTDDLLKDSLDLLEGENGQVDFKKVNKMLNTLCMDEMSKDQFDNLKCFFGEEGNFSAKTMYDTILRIKETPSAYESK